MKYILAALLFLSEPLLAQDTASRPHITINGIDYFPSFKLGSEEVYSYLEHMPSASYDIGQYLSSKVNYPKDAIKAGAEGRVMVLFIVTKNGTVDSAGALNSIHPSLDKEAVRVITDMPKWKPGMLDGKAVNTYYVLPIKFNLR